VLRRSSVVYASFFAFALVHCGGESSSSNGVGRGSGNLNAFLGTWSCVAKSTIEVTMPPGMPDQMTTSRFTFSITKSSDSTIAVGDTEEPSCSDELNVSGSKASIESPFDCNLNGAMLHVTMENLTVSGDDLTGTRTASVSAITIVGGDVSGRGGTAVPIAGIGTTTIDCTRISGPPDGGSTGGGNATGDSGAAGADGCANDTACVDCCSARYPAGNDVLTNLLVDCSCQQCGTECAASLCNDTNSTTPPDGDPCETCVRQALGDSGPCVQRARAACPNSGDCSVLAACLATCPSGSPI
jgi:hypothetical protein